ncbi:2-oxo-carboxylic acid reductase [Brochothrix thermosphacta]|uniref:NAD(P)-dependent oxidoreductase n=1 Tax=Brochothrix thermosphacta TaxID=2756 RepID=UPI000D79687C|nr:NAD(P)-dependent oxidoreductase [Brochothrix thermosphacta]SPP29650.1 2-oxo-carboxylic acid reductase [Brochothrix thermosphacta]
MKNIIVYRTIQTHLLEELKKSFNVKYLPDYLTTQKAEFEEALPTVNGLLGAGIVMGAEELQKMPQLEVVSNVTAGFDTLDWDAFDKAEVSITNAPDALTQTVADLAMGLLLAAARRITTVDRAIRANEWVKGPLDTATGLYGTDVYQKTIGIIGLGRIGTAVAQRAHAGFGMDVIYHTRSRHENAEVAYDAKHYPDLDVFLEAADFVVMLAPYSEETHHLMNGKTFSKMKDSAFFINVGRGKTVDETALYEALKTGVIAGAGLDVFEKEPIDQNHPLLTLDNVVVTAHMGSATLATRNRMERDAVANLTAVLNGEEPQNRVL